MAAVSKAVVVVGADGVIVEVHQTPEKALSDAAQQLNFDGFGAMMRDLKILSSRTPT